MICIAGSRPFQIQNSKKQEVPAHSHGGLVAHSHGFQSESAENEHGGFVYCCINVECKYFICTGTVQDTENPELSFFLIMDLLSWEQYVN